MGAKRHKLPLAANLNMAKRSRNYKIVNVASKSVGSTGAQILLGRVIKVDAQSVPSAWFDGIKLSAMVQEAEQDVAGMLFYLSTDDTWSDDKIIAAAATPGGPSGSAYLKARRVIRNNATPDDSNDLSLGSGGPVYLWLEAGDYVASESIRYVAETWGRHIKFEEL